MDNRQEKMSEDPKEQKIIFLSDKYIQLILKSLRKCVPDIEDQQDVFDLVTYLESKQDQ
jgi:hypothetical protein